MGRLDSSTLVFLLMFFSIDGGDGTGKSTQIGLFCQWLGQRGHQVVACRDPGSTPLGEAIRDLLLHKHDLAIGRRSEMLLYMAALAQLVCEVIRPALLAGKVVVADRYLLANVVYQGYGGGLDVAKLWDIGRVATGGLMPSLTIVLDLPAEVAARRLNREPDRMEMRGPIPRPRSRWFSDGSPAAVGPVSWSSMRRGQSKRCRPICELPPSGCWIKLPMKRSITARKICMSLAGYRRTRRRSRKAPPRRFAKSPGQQFSLLRAGRRGKTRVRPSLCPSPILPERPEADLDPCDTCPSSAMALAGTHPDIEVVAKPEDKAFLPVKLFIGENETRAARASATGSA